MSDCMVCPKKGECVPAISIKSAKLTKELHDGDGDGKICRGEVLSWVTNHFLVRANPILTKAMFTCPISRFNKEDAIQKLKAVRPQTNRDIELASKEFGNCSDNVKKYMQVQLSGLESALINNKLAQVEERGVGMGFVYNTYTGKVLHVMKSLSAEAAGLKEGDKLISVDDVRLEDSIDHAEAVKKKASKTEAALFFLKKRWEGIYFKYSFSETCFGACGSVATVVIERNGKRMTLKIERGVPREKE